MSKTSLSGGHCGSTAGPGGTRPSINRCSGPTVSVDLFFCASFGKFQPFQPSYIRVDKVSLPKPTTLFSKKTKKTNCLSEVPCI